MPMDQSAEHKSDGHLEMSPRASWNKAVCQGPRGLQWQGAGGV